MSYRLIVEKLMIERSNKKIITREELVREYCKPLKIPYELVISYLLSNKYLERIFRGIFYIKSIEERKIGKSDMTFYEILKEALKIKGVNNWYFGLETALKFNNLTHEYFTIDFIISDKIRRARPLNIMGRKVRFYAIKKELVKFGIAKHTFPYSDTEKTILDMVYLGIYEGASESTIKNRIIDYVDKCNKSKLNKYAKHYPKTVLNLIKRIKT